MELPFQGEGPTQMALLCLDQHLILSVYTNITLHFADLTETEANRFLGHFDKRGEQNGQVQGEAAYRYYE